MLAFYDEGSGKTILFLHGLGLNRNFWSSSIAQLSPAHRCIAIDLPGHGESRNAVCNGSMSAYAVHVREVIEQLELKDITLVGHSMGGQIAIILALQMPSVISKLVLVCPAGIETFTNDEREKMRAGANAIWRKPVAEEFLKNVYPALDATVSSSLMKEHITQQRENFASFSDMLCNSISGMLDEPVFAHLDKITQPVLCFFGQMDSAVPNRFIHPNMNAQDLAAAAKKQIRNCKTVIFPMAGHYLPVDSPGEFTNAINAFA